jgi:hypothetical protein
MTGQWFGVLAGKLLRRGDFTSRGDPGTRITALAVRHSKRARPCKWSYGADAGHARYLERRPRPNRRPPSPKPHDGNAQSPRPGRELVRGCTSTAIRPCTRITLLFGDGRTLQATPGKFFGGAVLQ